MKIINKIWHCLAIILVLLACLTEDTEARRRVLRGRRTITRTYSRVSAVPAWAIIVIAAIVEIAIGAGVFFGLKKWIVSIQPNNQLNTYRTAQMEDDV